jgi:hypothetical protein
MRRKSPCGPRPFETVMDELATAQDSWDLEQHLNGCLAATKRIPAMAPQYILHWRLCGGLQMTLESAHRAAQWVTMSWIRSG